MGTCGDWDGRRRGRRQEAVAAAGGVASMGGRQQQATGAADLAEKATVGEGGARRDRGGQRHLRRQAAGAEPVR